METWTLDHPEAGKLEVTVGPDVEFAEAYEDWPQEPSEQEYTALDANMPLKERIRAFINNPPIRVQVCLDSEVLGRYTSLSSARVALKQIDTDELRSIEPCQPHEAAPQAPRECPRRVDRGDLSQRLRGGRV